MKLRTSVVGLLLFVAATISFYACTKTESTPGKAHMQVYLTDDPGDFDAVFIDVKDVMINYSSDTSKGWVSLGNVNRGSYDLLRLVNDKDTILADADVQTGRIEQIRLVLGSNNYVIIDSQRYNLETPSAQQSGLKLNIHHDVNEGVLYKIVMDFDAARSVVKTGSGKYILKPVIRTTLQAIGGSVRGFVLPSTFNTAVFAIQGTDTVAGTYTLNGAYTIKGLQSGTYNFAYVPTDTTYASQSKSVVVNTNAVTVVDTVRLVKK